MVDDSRNGFGLMRRWFRYRCWYACVLFAAHAGAQDVDIDTKPSSAMQRAMLEAADSGRRQDWSRTIRSPFCNGCYTEPLNVSPEAELDPESAPMRISADDMDTVNDAEILLKGDVQVYQGWRRMRADSLRWFESEERIELEGDVQFREPGLLLTSDSAWVDNKNGISEFRQLQYLLHERGLRGGANSMRGRENHSDIRLEDASYTSCPPDDQTWKLQAARIDLDRESGFGKARSAVLDVKDIPVFYWPYIEFPIDDRRHSGFLWPSISGSDNGGIDLAVPYYFNLAPNYDATYTPRYLNTQGLIHEGELRYLNEISEWTIGATYLGNSERIDQVKTSDDPSLDPERWLTLVQEKGRFNRNWSSFVDYQRVSDISYFRDLGVTGLDANDALFVREAAGINYSNQHWRLTTLLEDHQKLVPDEVLADTYQLLPRLALSYNAGWTNRDWQPLFVSQYSYFYSDDDTAPVNNTGFTDNDRAFAARGQRLYAEPGISFPVRGLPGFIVPTAKIKHVSYELNDSNDFAQFTGSRSTTVPTFSLDGGLFFERDTVIGERNYLQTLEPRLFYYYADYVNQDSGEIPNFDTTKLFFSYSQLFRDRRFSSYDRIEDADQLTVATATRWIDQDDGREVFSIGLGQILYFRERQVTLSPAAGYNENIGQPGDPRREVNKYRNEELDKELYRNASDVAAEMQWHPSEQLTLLSSYIWDPYRDSTVEYALSTFWHAADYQTLLSGSYRFRRIEPLAFNFGTSVDPDLDLVDTNVEQFTLAAVYPLARRWTLYANWSYEMTNEHTIQDLFGAEYESCCYRLRLFYQRERDAFNALAPKTAADPLEYGYSWMLQVELKGLGGITNKLTQLLEENFYGYDKREEYRYQTDD